MPHYKQRVGAIEKLLMCKGEVRWTVEGTQALNDLLRCVWNRVRLVSADPHGVLLLYPSVTEGLGSWHACRIKVRVTNLQPLYHVSSHVQRRKLDG